MTFVENDLPKIFKNVLHSLPLSKRQKCEPPRKQKRVKKSDKYIQCEECLQSMASKRKLTQQKILYHTKSKVKKSKKVKTCNNISGPLFFKLRETVSEEIKKSMNHLIYTLSPQKEQETVMNLGLLEHLRKRRH